MFCTLFKLRLASLLIILCNALLMLNACFCFVFLHQPLSVSVIVFFLSFSLSYLGIVVAFVWFHLTSFPSLLRYRKIPKINPPMYKPLQIISPPNCKTKNPPLNHPSKYKPPQGFVLGKLPSNTK